MHWRETARRAMMRMALPVLALGAAVLAAAGAGAREFRLADTHPDTYPTVQAALHMGRLVAERSGGRHAVRVFHSRQLGEEKETIEQTRVGAIDLNRVNLAPLADLIPECKVASLPFLFRSQAHLHAVLDGPVGAEILAAFERHGLVGLAFYDSGARSIYNTRRPIRMPDDVKGLRIRVQQSDLNVAMLEALGATAVPLPFGEVNTALVTGIIDGAENNWPSYEQNEHHHAARIYALTEHSMAPEVLVMSKKAWDALPVEDQALFRAVARESASVMHTLWAQAEHRSEQAARASGVQVIADVDKEAFRRRMLPVYDRFVTDPALKDLVRRIQATE
ncbi:TRAP transporter substrate-binding protein [Azospirillum sp. sgz301742]